MGMIYDESAECWRLDLPCRINGKPTHLKDTVYGPKRKTQAEAMTKWLELNNRARDPAGAITFGEDCDKYIKENPRIGQGIVSIVNHLKSGLGTTKRRDFEPKFKEWIDIQEKRNVMKWRRKDGELKLCDTGKPISKSTIQAYKRYAKLIARENGYGEAFKDIKVGRRIVRRRPIEVWEMLKLEETIQKHFAWFFPAFDFARTNPIRPEDQFSLTVEKHYKNGKIVYAPQKTFEDTGLMAYPIIWEHQQAFFDSVVSGLIFCRPDGVTLMESENSRYYDFIWGKILNKAGLSDIRFYDLKHHAVSFMRSRGVEDWRIVKAAGWSSAEMLYDYDPDNTAMIDKYDSTLNKVANCSTESSTEIEKPLILLGETGENY